MHSCQGCAYQVDYCSLRPLAWPFLVVWGWSVSESWPAGDAGNRLPHVGDRGRRDYCRCGRSRRQRVERAVALPEGRLVPDTRHCSMVAAAGLGACGQLRMAAAIGVIVVALDVTTFAAGAVHTMPTESPATLQRWLGAPSEGRALSLCGNRIDQVLLAIHRQPTLEGTRRGLSARLHRLVRRAGDWRPPIGSTHG